MKSIIVAYPKKNTAMKLRSALEEEGLYVSHICATGASVLGIAADMRSGVVGTASILSDMSATVIADRLPPGFDVVALSHSGREDYMGNLISLPLPLDRQEFISTIRVLVATETSFTNRNLDDSELISSAKTILMNVHGITEMQAHKRLQQESMRTSKKLVDVARDIISQFS